MPPLSLLLASQRPLFPPALAPSLHVLPLRAASAMILALLADPPRSAAPPHSLPTARSLYTHETSRSSTESLTASNSSHLPYGKPRVPIPPTPVPDPAPLRILLYIYIARTRGPDRSVEDPSAVTWLRAENAGAGERAKEYSIGTLRARAQSIKQDGNI